MTRGYACVGLDNPKFDVNVGGVMRACFNYGAAMVVIGGGRFKKHASDTTKAWRHIPLIRHDDVLAHIPYGCVPVAVDIVDGAIPLPQYIHPERAFYIFGAEDETLGSHIVDKCRDVVFVPTRICMNLAAAVNVVLYDRIAKQLLRSPATLRAIKDAGGAR